ncbi:efflux RND transporter periplasmic adaptor subunit [Methylonatrum kenyense]|uniref:efflux RND transporter periplasmic adaptor subunit n=1 Tax=Methylonatrum kenyense TaxID=455253 RepID=UPI0020C0A20E|nr:efflux RND transporter periplasmic adaptor subunit [Methylonatrum kenyense]MCK8516003.1 efflux RND transporter periplasmic adaptor subunit [Methylonatrum kenyense]
MSLTRKALYTLLGLALVGGIIVLLLPAPLPVSTVIAERGPFSVVIEEEGRMQLRDPHRVSAPISGFLRRVVLEPGDTVNAGDALFELEAMPSPSLDPRAREQAREAVSAAQARLELAQSELDIRRTQRQLAESELQRHETLHDQQFLSTEQLERSRSQRDASRAAERSARHAIEIASFELEAARIALAIQDGERAPETQPTLTVRAPISGTIVARPRCCEGPINAGDLVLEIGDLEQLEARVDLLSMDAVQVEPGTPVRIERWGRDEPLQGTVRRVEPRGFERTSALGVEEHRVPVLIRIDTERVAWQRLGDGYRIEARFVIWEEEDVLQLPSSALFRSGRQWQVFAVRDDRAQRRDVEIGQRSGGQVQIISGLEPGEEVIIHPSDRISDGSRVRPDPV